MTDKRRLQLDLSERQFAALHKVQAHIDTKAYAEVFRRALVIMERIVDIEQKGEFQFGFVDKDNQFQQVWFL